MIGLAKKICLSCNVDQPSVSCFVAVVVFGYPCHKLGYITERSQKESGES